MSTSERDPKVLDAEAVERTARAAVAMAHEGLHVELKGAFDGSENQAAWIAKHVVAIANADEPELRPGLLVLGVRRGRILGKVERLATEEGFTAAENRILSFIEPLPPIDLYYFRDAEAGGFGAVVIHSSPDGRPFMMKKDGKTDEGEPIRVGDCFIRRGSSSVRAVRGDFDRWYRKRYGVDKRKVRLELLSNDEKADLDIDLVRPRFAADVLPRNPGSMADFMAPSNEDIAAFVSKINRTLRLGLRLRNSGDRAAENVIVDLTVRGGSELAIYPDVRPRFSPVGPAVDPYRHLVDPSEHVHVNRPERIADGFRLRQRIKQVAAGATERLVRFGLRGEDKPEARNLLFRIGYEIRTEDGEAATGEFRAAVRLQLSESLTLEELEKRGR